MKYLVISVDDDTAKRLSRRFAEKVVGTYVQPRAFCDCPDKQRQNLSNWARGKRSGIPVCKVCRRPSPVWADVLPRLEVALGRRLENGNHGHEPQG